MLKFVIFFYTFEHLKFLAVNGMPLIKPKEHGVGG